MYTIVSLGSEFYVNTFSHQGCMKLIKSDSRHNIRKEQKDLNIEITKMKRILQIRIMISSKTSPGYVCNHGSLRERDAASPRFGNALCVTGSESAV